MALTLVLLPGLDGTGILFEPIVRQLPLDILPHVIPLPNDIPMGYDRLVPAISSLLPTGCRYVLLGESFSGPLTLMIAAQQPTGLQGVILCASFIRNPTYLPSGLRYIAGSWMFHLTPQLAQAKALFAGYSTSQLRSLLARAHSQVPPSVMAQRIRSVLAVDCQEALQKCPVPIAYIRGSQDRVVPAKNCRQVLSARPAVREFVIHAPHLVLQTQPQAAAKAITTFVRDVGGA
jgi:pimeloyl-[acyl-carrier protein] methyl ester esterase